MKKLISLLMLSVFITACTTSSNEVFEVFDGESEENFESSEGVSDEISEQKLNEILTSLIKTIIIEDLSDRKTIEIRNEVDINTVLDALKLSDWEVIEEWDLKLSPSIFVAINDEIVIGLFQGENYAKIENNKVGNVDRYFEIPNDIASDIIKAIYN